MRRYQDPLFAEKRRRHPTLALLLLLLILVIAMVLVLNQVNNSRVNLMRQNVTVPSLPAALENYRILHISDLHGLYFGPNQERLGAAVDMANYRIVCITGDVCGPDGDYGAFIKLLELFDADTPVYFVPGDEDPPPLLSQARPDGTVKADYILAAEAKGAVYLDAPEKITVGGATLWLDPEWMYGLDVNGTEAALANRREEIMAQPDSSERASAAASLAYQTDQINRILDARRETLENDTHVALIHIPLSDAARQDLRSWLSTENDRYIRQVALILAGHCVGGQWRLPVLGAVRAPVPSNAMPGENGAWFPGDDNILGISYSYGVSQYINPGLGVSSRIALPGIRLFNTPAITQITLTGRLTD